MCHTIIKQAMRLLMGSKVTRNLAHTCCLHEHWGAGEWRRKMAKPSGLMDNGFTSGLATAR